MQFILYDFRSELCTGQGEDFGQKICESDLVRLRDFYMVVATSRFSHLIEKKTETHPMTDMRWLDRREDCYLAITKPLARTSSLD